VTNAVQASAGLSSQLPGYEHENLGLPAVWLWLTSDGQQIMCEVGDSSPRTPITSTSELDVEGGRGLLLVETVSRQWGYYFPADEDDGQRKNIQKVVGPPPGLRGGARLRCPSSAAGHGVSRLLDDRLHGGDPGVLGGVAVGQDGDQQLVLVVLDLADGVDGPQHRIGQPAVLDQVAAPRIGGGGNAPLLVGLDLAHEVLDVVLGGRRER